jgi:hypothetical protein
MLTLPVNKEGGQEADDDLDDADDDCGDHRRHGAAGRFEDGRRVKNDCVDAGQLLEQHQTQADEHRLARHALREDRAQRLHLRRRLRLLPLHRRLHRAQLLGDVAAGAAQFLQRQFRLTTLSSAKSAQDTHYFGNLIVSNRGHLLTRYKFQQIYYFLCAFYYFSREYMLRKLK